MTYEKRRDFSRELVPLGMGTSSCLGRLAFA
jgi:hypothetical protein